MYKSFYTPIQRQSISQRPMAEFSQTQTGQDDMKPSDLQSRINDLQLKIGDLRESSLDPSQSLEVALEKLSSALEELNVAQEELCQQDESLQSAYLTIESERQRYLSCSTLRLMDTS
jgi:chromosome segregation ATPase